MSDRLDASEEPTAAERAVVDTWLARAGDEDVIWAHTPAALEALVVASVNAEIASDGRVDGADDVADSAVRTMWGASGVPWWLGAVAAVVAVIAGLALINRGGDDGTVFALTGTSAAPDASAELVVSPTPAGLRLMLDARGLPGAPVGTYYEAWVTDGTVRVSAGTFHLRHGVHQIELWAGVVGPEFNQLAVTLEPIDGDNGSSGDAYLLGSFAIDD